MSLGHQCKIVLLFDEGKVSITDTLNSISSNRDSNKLCHPGDDFILLSLVVDDGNFPFIRCQELCPKERIPGSYDDDLGIEARHPAG